MKYLLINLVEYFYYFRSLRQESDSGASSISGSTDSLFTSGPPNNTPVESCNASQTEDVDQCVQQASSKLAQNTDMNVDDEIDYNDDALYIDLEDLETFEL